jgi:O-methyltransferase involved in polyketide biosynthesis
MLLGVSERPEIKTLRRSMTGESSNGEELLRRLNTAVPHPARVYDVWLGGKDNYPADRAAAAAGLEAFPSTIQSVRANRAFLARAVEYLAAEEGIRQFLDIGTGLPSANNTHEVAQVTAEESRVVYVDNDPVVITHAHALLVSTPEGACDYLQADVRDVDAILAGAARTLDFTQPVAVLMLQLLHFVPEEDNPYGIVRRIMDAVPPGSFLVLAHGSLDVNPAVEAQLMKMAAASATRLRLRDRAEVTRFFDGLELIAPGLVSGPEWLQTGPDDGTANPADIGFGYSGVARKA